MKKTYFLAAAALMTLAACNKSETVITEAPGSNELGFKVMSQNVTKTGELTGISLPKAYGIYTAATQKNAAGIIENPSFFASPFEQLFGTTEADDASFNTADAIADTRLWHAGSYAESTFTPAPIYWPIGGVKMDFLGYSLPMADHNSPLAIGATVNTGNDWAVLWDNQLTDVASQFTFYDVDTYANQIDLMYAYANNQTNTANGGAGKSVAMAFNHAQALLIFNVRVNEEATGKMQIDEIAFYTDDRVDAMRADQVAVAGGASSALATLADADVTLKTFGTFRVDNSRNDLQAYWMFGKDIADAAVSATKKENFKMPGGTSVSASNNVVLAQGEETGGHGDINVNYGAAIAYSENTAEASEYRQLGETLLIPEQEKVNFTITYTIGGKTFFYTYNDLRGVWEKGKKYIYNLDITMNEIVITESVANWGPAAQAVPLN